MHGNVAPAQCLEVFSLRVASWKLLRYVFHWKLCWLIPPLSRAVGSKVEVHGDLEITALPPPSRRFAVKGRFCSKGHFCLSVSLKACAKVSCSVTKGEEAGHLSVKLKHTRHFPQFYLLFAKRPRGFSTWPWMWDAVTSCNGLKSGLVQRPRGPPTSDPIIWLPALTPNQRERPSVCSACLESSVNPSRKACLWQHKASENLSLFFLWQSTVRKSLIVF